MRGACFTMALCALTLSLCAVTANAVLLYDGTADGADPFVQGWVIGTAGNAGEEDVLMGDGIVDPEPGNNRVHIARGRAANNRRPNENDARIRQVPDNAVISPILGNDNYAFEIDIQLVQENHAFAEFGVITGINSGSLGFRDRFFIEGTQNNGGTDTIPGGTPRPDRIRVIGTTPLINPATGVAWSTDISPADHDGYNSNSELNTIRWVRKRGLVPALGFEVDGGIADMFINGTLVYQGHSGLSSIGSAQVDIGGQIESPEPTDLYMSRFELFPEPAGTPCDFNGDSNCDDVDIDLLADAVRNGTSDSQFNVDGLGDLNIPDDADFDFYITDDSMLSTGRGDHDLDFNVNFIDFVRLSNNFNMSPTGWAQGNGNTDDNTNFNDFVRLSNNFGMNFASGSNVPEPAAVGALGMLALVWLRKRH